MAPINAGIAAFFSVAPFVFYVIAACGYSKDYKVLKGCQWFYYQDDVTYTLSDDYYAATEVVHMKVYFGLKGYYTHYDLDLIMDEFYYYYSSDDSYSNKCDKSGKITFILIIIACIFSFISIVTNGVGFVNEETAIKACGAVLSIISCLFGIIAVSVFMTSCYKKFHDFVHDNNDILSTKGIHYGNSFILSLTALLSNFVSFSLIMINIITNDSKILATNRINPDVKVISN